MNAEAIRNITFNTTQLHVIASSTVSHIRFEEETSRPTVYIGQCTQMNLLAAIENFKAPIIGFANPLVQTQVFNCHKLNTENAGIPVDLIDDESLDLKATISKVLADQSMFKNVAFYHNLLEDQKKSKMDMNYWLDYVVKFGVKDLIPVYDNMGIIEYRNWDVYAMLFFVVAVIVWTIFQILKLVLCCGKKKVKVE